MKTVCEKDKCTGCMACRDVCPKNAIIFSNSFKAYNALIDSEKCIDCGACNKVCQVNNPLRLNKPIKWYQGWGKDSEIRNNSSSGGVATSIEKAFLKNDGIVCSCVFKDGAFTFDLADNVNDIKRFSGSKYVKSNPLGCYIKVKKRLSEGKKVLFVGLPCQVAAVKIYVGERYISNLYTIDLICHGSPDPKVLEDFLLQYNISLPKIKDISFRTKTSFHLRKNYKSIAMAGIKDNYTIAFLNAICYTDNCYECQYAKRERVSDITLGDSWGTELTDKEKNKGISLVICNSEKGKKLLNQTELELMEVDIERAIRHNQQLQVPSSKPEKRDYFIKQLEKGKKFNHIIYRCFPKSCFKQLIKGIMYKIKPIKGGTIEYRITYIPK